MPRNSPEIERCRNALREQLKLAQNKRCADCGTKQPTWASTNIGVFVCIRCSGIHRNLGTHISKVKSTTLDSWTYKLLDHFTKQGGTRAVNSRYEAKLPKPIKPTESTDTYSLEQFIRAKYCHKKWFSNKIPKQDVNSSSSDDSSSDSKSRVRNGRNIRNGKRAPIKSSSNGTAKISKTTRNGKYSQSASVLTRSQSAPKNKTKNNKNIVPSKVRNGKKLLNQSEVAKPTQSVPDLLNPNQLDYLSGNVNENTNENGNILLKFTGLSVSNSSQEASKSSILSKFHSNNNNNNNNNNSPFAHIMNPKPSKQLNSSGSLLLPAENTTIIPNNGNGNGNGNGGQWIGFSKPVSNGNVNGNNNANGNIGGQPDLIDLSEIDRAKNDILSKFKTKNNDVFGLNGGKNKSQVPSGFMTQLQPNQPKPKVNSIPMNSAMNMNMNMGASINMNGMNGMTMMDSVNSNQVNKQNVTQNLANLYKQQKNIAQMNNVSMNGAMIVNNMGMGMNVPTAPNTSSSVFTMLNHGF